MTIQATRGRADHESPHNPWDHCSGSIPESNSSINCSRVVPEGELPIILGFRFRNLEQDVPSDRHAMIGVLTSDIYGRFSLPLLMGIEEAFEGRSISAVLCTMRDQEQEQAHIQMLLERQVDGIVVSARREDPRPPINLGQASLPLIYAHTQVTDPGALCVLPEMLRARAWLLSISWPSVGANLHTLRVPAILTPCVYAKRPCARCWLNTPSLFRNNACCQVPGMKVGATPLPSTSFFYENPLESDGTHHHQPWYKCACCPPNIARLLLSLGSYLYSVTDTDILVHLYAQSSSTLTIGERRITVHQHTNYPWDGTVRLEIATDKPAAFGLHLRIPGWCQHARLTLGDEEIPFELRKGYARVTRTWRCLLSAFILIRPYAKM